MPTYLCHGFRWQRRSIRVYVVVQNLDDASPEWIIPAKSSQCILESFYNLFEFLPYRAPPSRSSGGWSGAGSDDDDSVFNTAAYTPRNGGRSRSQSQSQSQSQSHRSRSQSQSQSQSRRSQSRSRSRSRAHSNATRDEAPPPLPHRTGREDDISSQDWSVVKLLEEYDPMNLDEVSRPYAYVADYVKRIDLSASIFEEIQKYEELVRANKDDPPMVLSSGAGSSDETGRGSQKSSKKKGSGWFEQMRDQLQRGEEIRWYVVVNGDEVRDWPDEPVRKNDMMAQQRPTPTKEQMQHHRQYMLQQQIFRDKDKHVGRKNIAPVPVRGVTGGDGREKQEQHQQQKAHAKGHGGGGGFRRLFSKSSSRGDDHSY
ncbi:hypothetical protein V8F20_002596 [Naviculisporaceae sp. PSN 640]